MTVRLQHVQSPLPESGPPRERRGEQYRLILEMSNPIMIGMNPEQTNEGLKRIPYLLDLTIYLDETARVKKYKAA